MCSALALGACSGDGGTSSTASLPADITTPDISIGDDAGSIVDGERDPAGGDTGSPTPPEPGAVEPDQPEGGDADAPASGAAACSWSRKAMTVGSPPKSGSR